MKLSPNKFYKPDQGIIPLFDNFIKHCGLDNNEQYEKVTIGYCEDNIYNSPFDYCGWINYNKEICEKLNLSIMEMYAFIAHEIGHHLDNTPGSQTEERENNADDFAISLGLSDELISGMHKLIDSKLYSEQEINSLAERIRRIEQKK